MLRPQTEFIYCQLPELILFMRLFCNQITLMMNKWIKCVWFLPWVVTFSCEYVVIKKMNVKRVSSWGSFSASWLHDTFYFLSQCVTCAKFLYHDVKNQTLWQSKNELIKNRFKTIFVFIRCRIHSKSYFCYKHANKLKKRRWHVSCVWNRNISLGICFRR